MAATVTHTPKAGATLTGTEYEASDHHVVTIAAADIGAAADNHDHDADYAATGHTHAVVSGAGVPSGAPTGTRLPIAVDTGTGYVYLWNGSAWLEVITTG